MEEINEERRLELQKQGLNALTKQGEPKFTETWFPYTSGEVGPYFIQSIVVEKDGEDYFNSINALCELIKGTIGLENFDVIGGGETRDWDFSNPVAAFLKKPHVKVYKDGKTLGAEVEGKKVVLLCGYFRPTKGFHKIVEIFPEICEKINNAVLMIAGKSRGLEYKDYQKEFFEAINSSSVNDKILVLRGQFPQKTFDTIISASDVVALPYEIGGQSGVMAHCYAFGKPVVTSALPAFKKSIEHSQGGLTCETKQDYVKNIIELITNDNLRHEMQINIRNYVKDQVGWRKIAQSHVKVYQSVVKVPYGKARHVFWE